MAKAEEIPGLESGLSVSEGAQRILTKRLEEMCASREPALDWSDPEGVHDMRVVSRRLRSALRDFLPFLPHTHGLRRWGQDLCALSGVLGAVRDHDVALAAFARLIEKAPDETTAAGLAGFVAGREAQREKARATLTEAVAVERLAVLQARFVLAFDDSFQAARKKSRGTSLGQAGKSILAAGWQDFARLSDSLYAPLRPRPLHRLRIVAKRLRYALELFAPFWRPETLAPIAAQVAAMQSALGDLHDCDIWLADCSARLKSSTTERPARDAAFWLMRQFIRDRTDSYRKALVLWHDWERTGLAQQLADALHTE